MVILLRGCKLTVQQSKTAIVLPCFWVVYMSIWKANNLISVSSVVLTSLNVHLRTKHDQKITNVTKNCSHANKLFAILSASQYLYAQCRVECNNFSYYMAKPVLSKFMRCNWFFLCQDFAAKPLPWKRSKPYTFFLEQSQHIWNLQPNSE